MFYDHKVLFASKWVCNQSKEQASVVNIIGLGVKHVNDVKISSV